MHEDPVHRAWPRALPPQGRRCRQWSPTGLRGLAGVRQDFRAEVARSADGPPGMDGDQVEDAVTALDEMVSNALRHGLAPVAVEVCTHDRGYVLLVSDHAPDAPPQPTSVRDPAEGGMGLGMVASTALACGWLSDRCAKTVWALMPGGPTPPSPGLTTAAGSAGQPGWSGRGVRGWTRPVR